MRSCVDVVTGAAGTCRIEGELLAQYKILIMRMRHAATASRSTPRDVAEAAQRWKVAERFRVRPVVTLQALWSLRRFLHCGHAQQCKLLHLVSAFLSEPDKGDFFVTNGCCWAFY